MARARVSTSFRNVTALLLLSSFTSLGVFAQDGAQKGAQSTGSPAAASPQTAGSEGAPATTLSVNVKVVTLPVTVRDKHGEIVRNLTPNDFKLQEDGKPQTIRYFTEETNLPLTLGLLVDTSMSQRNVLDQERSASKSFLDQMVTNKDRAFVIHFDHDVELLQDLTADHSKLEAALQLIQPSSYEQTSSSGDGSSQDGSSRPMHRGGGTLLYDSIFLASDELMKKQTGRKAVIVLSDGVDRGSKESLASAIESAQRADTIVYAIYFADKHDEGNRGFGNHGGGGYPGGGGGGYPGRFPGGGYPGGGYPGGGGGYPGGGGGYPGGGHRGGGGGAEPHVDGKKILDQIARETGGRLFEVSKKETVDQIYGEIAEELRSQYMMGYTPAKSDVSGYHIITLTPKKKDLTVQTRAGYYGD